MKVIQSGNPGLLAIVVLVVFALACDSISGTERSLVRADAEVFETIIRSEIPDKAGDSTVSPGFLRVDARPVGDNEALAGGEKPKGLDLERPADTTSAKAIAQITDQRRAILKLLHLEEGGPFLYPDCGGTKPRRVKGAAALVGANCPKEFRRYVTVGLPYRGAAQALDKLRSREAPAPDSTSEVWTVLVTESSIGPGGQDWRKYAWLLRRNPDTNRLGLAERFLVSWAE
ncbi:MAG TPA: hypothetical protein VM166_01225 [Gemmatimonadaceae bacterium]|nr:hypothetical protein [Gemmatimonadaceae bacterium]